MKVEWDFSELTKFANNVVDIHNLDTAMMTATQKIARVLHQYLLIQTPVKTGNLRKMWSAGDNLLFTVDEVPNGFQVTLINKARSGADATSDDETTGFMYGLAVNDGHKKSGGGRVKGRFFVERSIIQTAESSQLKSIIMREIQKWWEGCF